MNNSEKLRFSVSFTHNFSLKTIFFFHFSLLHRVISVKHIFHFSSAYFMAFQFALAIENNLNFSSFVLDIRKPAMGIMMCVGECKHKLNRIESE